MRVLNYSRNLYSEKAFDVVVVGSGPAGLAAAVSSSRQGARTALVERYGTLGGNITSGHVGPLMGRVSNGTIVDEVHKAFNTWFGGPQHDVEKSKIFFINWTKDAGAEVLLQAPVVDAIVEAGNIQGLVIGTKNGLEVIKGSVIIDATGDGTVSYLSGAECMTGRDGDGLLQPVSLMYTVAGVNTANALYCGGEQSNVMYNGEKYVDFCHKKHDEGELPENVAIVRLYPSVNSGEVMVNATQANYIDGLELKDIVTAEINLRNQMVAVTEFLRKYVPGYADCYIKDSADTLGIRETRRVKGDYVLQDNDLLEGRKFPDVMVHNARFVIDIHNPTGGGQAEGLAKAVNPYDIPYRCFLPVGINNLMTAGRCISGTHRAHASYRVMNICMAMGQAAGTAAALSVRQGTEPRGLDYKLIQESLIKQGVDLFD